MPKRHLVLAVIVVVAIAAAGCGSDSGKTGAQATGGAAPQNAADVTFAQMMIPHHEQAIEMAKLASARASSSDVKALATRIEGAQTPEIETMKTWLADWDEPVGPSGGGMAGMPGMAEGGATSGDGMMSESEMTALKSATGTAFDKLFLEAMVKHHRAAVTMALDEVKNGRFPDATALAGKIAQTQEKEIAEMETLLKAAP